MDNTKVEQLLKKIHDDGVLKAEMASEEIICQAREKAKRIIHEAEEKARELQAMQEREIAKVNNSLQEAIKLTVRDLKLTFEAEVINKINKILSLKVKAMLKNDDSQILKWILESNLYEVKEGVTVESASCGLEVFKTFALNEFKDQIETIDFELSDQFGFRLKLKKKNLILDYSEGAISDYLIELLGEDIKEVFRDTRENEDELKPL